MIKMYSEKERNAVFDYLVEKFRERNEILSVIQVGSGAIGYRDKYSDLDFAIVTNETNITNTTNTTNNTDVPSEDIPSEDVPDEDVHIHEVNLDKKLHISKSATGNPLFVLALAILALALVPRRKH